MACGQAAIAFEKFMESLDTLDHPISATFFRMYCCQMPNGRIFSPSIMPNNAKVTASLVVHTVHDISNIDSLINRTSIITVIRG